MGDWQSIKSAPLDREVELLTGRGFVLRAKWELGFMNDAGDDCGGWVATEEGRHPEDWSEGACWESNEECVPSDQPIMWRALIAPAHPPSGREG